MAKVYESDIDPDEFIRSFREEPSSTGGLKRVQINEESSAAPVEEPPTPISKPARTKGKSMDEGTFVNTFIRDTSNLHPRIKYCMVDIYPEFVKKIRRIISHEDDRAYSVKAYINNVLAQHFKEYEEIINKRL